VAQINQLSVTSGSVSLPNSGSVAIFSNVDDNGNLYIKTFTGTVTPVGNTSGGGGSGSSGSSGTSGTGVSGSSGTSGTQGIAGSSGTSGTAGAPGATGSSGTSGTQGVAGSSGTSGTQGVAGSSGTSGTQGVAGSSGSSGTAGTSGTGITSGTSGATGAPGSSGTSGAAGSPGAAGSSGTSGTGGGGGGGTATQYNTISRYQAYTNGSDKEAWFVSSATVNTGLTWSRSTTTLTITHNTHGLNNGEAVVIRNANADNFYAIVTVSDSNTFTVTTVDSGGTSGTAAAYSKAFTVSGTPTDSALTIAAPSTGDVQLLGLLYTTGARTTTTLAVTVPASATNGAGANSTVLNQFYPILRVQLVTGAITGTAAMTLNTSSNFNVFNITSLSGAVNSLVRLTFS
jgi:hypothetical protein